MSTASTSQNPSSRPQSSRRWLYVGLVAAIIAAAVFVERSASSSASNDYVWHTVQRGDLSITVTERGNLQSQDQEIVYCEVDDIEGDGIHGTPIVWIVPNGKQVQEGEVICQLDSAGLTERLDRQYLDTDKARTDQIRAQVSYENQITQNETAQAEAELKVRLAELALEQFEDEEGGTFQITLQDIELQIQEAQQERLIAQTNLQGVEDLYSLGYRSRGELDQARLSSIRASRSLASSLARKKELVDYQYRKTKLELEGAVASARRSLEQVTRDNEADLARARAELDNANQALEKEEERLARYKDQLAKCEIRAPQSGMVAYATSQNRWRREEIREGAAVRLRQPIVTIPNLERMQVMTAVHESVLDQIDVGLPVTIRVDVFSDRAYRGSVQSVAVLPDEDQLASSGTKVYPTTITIDEQVEQLKPGMTAVAEIHVAYLEDVLSIPVQAVVQLGRDNFCFVDAGSGAPERRVVQIGRTNNRFVEVVEGLEEGDRVVLNPDDLVDWSENDEGKSASGDDDDISAAFKRNEVPRESEDSDGSTDRPEDSEDADDDVEPERLDDVGGPATGTDAVDSSGSRTGREAPTSIAVPGS